jgi:membrane protein
MAKPGSTALEAVAVFRLLARAGHEWTADRASFLGAALAYYALFSMAPVLLIAIVIAGLAFGEEAAEGNVVGYLTDYVGPDSAQAVQALIRAARVIPGGQWRSLVGVAVLLYAAINLFQQARTALNLVWKLPDPPTGGLTRWLRDLVSGFILVLIVGMFVMLLAASSLATAWLMEDPAWHAVLNATSWPASEFGIALALQTLALIFAFRFLSDGRVPYRHLILGSFVAALLLSAGKLLFGLYLRFSNVATVYGAASSIVVFLVWIYFSAQIVIYGAEIVKVSMRKDSQASGLG